MKKYDCVISIGAACFVPDALKHLKVRKFSGPFDWMYGSNVETRLKCVYDEFNNYFDYKDFEYLEVNKDNGKAIYKNKKTGIVYNHDFEPGDFNKTFPPVAEKYKETSKAISEVKFETRQVIRKTLVEMMKQSFFHGASRYGTNFIA